MRRKIAKRKRRDILQRATIVKEEWIREPGWRRKDCAYVVEARCCGWKIFSPGYDELEAYKGLLFCIEACEEKPMEED